MYASSIIDLINPKPKQQAPATQEVKGKKGAGKSTGISGSQVAKIEQDIDDFLENFRRKSSVLDYSQTGTHDNVTGQYSSSQYSTDENTDDSPDRAYHLGVGNMPIRGHRRQCSNTTTTSGESEWGPEGDDYVSGIVKNKVITSSYKQRENSPSSSQKQYSSSEGRRDTSSPYTSRRESHSSMRELSSHTSQDEKNSHDSQKEHSSRVSQREHQTHTSQREHMSRMSQREHVSRGQQRDTSSHMSSREHSSHMTQREHAPHNQQREHSSHGSQRDLSSNNSPREHHSNNHHRDHSAHNSPREHSSRISQENPSFNQQKEHPSHISQKEHASHSAQRGQTSRSQQREQTSTISQREQASHMSQRGQASHISQREQASHMSQREQGSRISQREQASHISQRDQASPISQRDRASPISQRDQASPISQRDRASPISQREQASPIPQREQASHISQRDQASHISQRDQASHISQREQSSHISQRDQASHVSQREQASHVAQRDQVSHNQQKENGSHISQRGHVSQNSPREHGFRGPQDNRSHSANRDPSARASPKEHLSRAAQKEQNTPQRNPQSSSVPPKDYNSRVLQKDNTVRALQKGQSPQGSPFKQSKSAISTDKNECEEEMVEAVCPYSVLDVAQLLQAKYAFVSGGKAKNGAPIMTFPENPQQPDISDDAYKKIVTYLCCIPPLHESELGFVVVLDRRQASWGSVKSLLLKIAEFFPKHVQVVFLLQPHGFFQRAFSEMKSKFVKEELEFKVVMCNDPAELHEYIDPSMLSVEIGGHLEYDANEWTQHRAAVEKFSSNTDKISTSVKLLVKKYEETEIPNDVKGTEQLIHDHILGRKEMLDDLSSSEAHGQTILSCIKGDNVRTPLIHQTHVLNLERLLVQLEETKINFGKFWDIHEKRLKQSLQLRKFEEEFKLFQYGAENRLTELQTNMNDVGETVQQVANLIKEFETFEELSKRDLDQAERLRTEGEQLIVDDHYAVDSIRPKCIELQRMCDQYRQLLRRRRELLNTSNDLQDRIDKANRWCTKGVDMLSNQQVETCQTHDGAELAIRDIETFVTTANELRLNNPKEFRQLFESIITSDTRANVQKVLKRIEDVQCMCEKRKDSLLKYAKPQSSSQKSQQKPPPPSSSSSRQTQEQSEDLKRRLSADLSQQKTSVMFEKSARMRTDGVPSRPVITGPLPKTGSIPDSLGEKSRSSLSSMSTTTSSGSSASTGSTSMIDLDTLLAKRRHVLNELIETEKTYVVQLYDIIKGYLRELDNRSMQHLIPQELVGKKEILFGNLEQIYDFHKKVFLQELQNCRDAPGKVGKCFANRKEEFHLYSVYCQNKLRSEALRNQVGDQNPFFVECQKRLGHKLPLGAYLLKPVQRITKYQLLLKEMLRFTDNDQLCEAHLQEALDSMLDVVRHVNDSMHQVSIVSFPGNIADQGRLLMQGSFSVHTEHQRGRIKDLRFKPMQRHMFLYEKSILLCKRKEENGQLSSEKGVYSFKNLLKLAQVGLTENIKGDKRKFELWLRGREEVYIIQAPNLGCKEMWVKEIKRVLQIQFDQLKLTHLNLLGQSEEDLHDIPDDHGQRHKYVDNWQSQSRGSYNNNTPTVPQGLEMMSPESPPTLHEDDGWSSGEYTNSDDEEAKHYHSHQEPAHQYQYRSIGDYQATDPNEVTLREGDLVEILRMGSTGWWYARHLLTDQEGWVPSTYLVECRKHGSQSQFSVSSFDSSSQDHMTSKSSIASAYSTTSPVDETTI